MNAWSRAAHTLSTRVCASCVRLADARSFAISAAFAAEHSRVASVKNFKAVKKTRSQRSREKHRQERRAKKHGSRAERTARRTSQMMLEAEAKQFRSQRR